MVEKSDFFSRLGSEFLNLQIFLFDIIEKMFIIDCAKFVIFNFYWLKIMQIAVWIIIILVIAFLIWLLKRWIKRIIFILILLALAFFIYWIFNPSWAAKLWYNVRTFPSRMASRMWSGKEFLDYDSYKSKISSVWDSISDTIGDIWDKIDSVWDKIDSDIDDEDFDYFDLDEVDYDDDDYDEKTDYDFEDEEKESTKNTGKNVIKAFPRAIKFVEVPELKQEVKSESNETLPWYSRTDLLWIINRYLEKNLDDDTDILVTVEYDEDSADPQKIILQTQPKNEHSVWNSDSLMDEVFSESDRKVPEDIEIIPVESVDSKVEESQPVQKQETVKKQGTTKKTTSTKLTQKEQKEAEEIFWILF